MSDSKGANRLYLAIVAAFVVVSLLINKVASGNIPMYLSLVLGQMAVLVPALVYCWKRKIAVTKWIPYRKISFSTGVLVVVTTYLMYPLTVVLNAITLLFTDSKTASMQVEMADSNIVIATLIIAVIPACVEEFVFRGILLQTYRRKQVFSAILLSAFLFGCMHRNLNQFVYTFVIGIYMAFLVEGTGSIFSSMIAHFTFNFTGVIMAKLAKIISDVQGNSTMSVQNGNFLQNDSAYVTMLLIGILVWFIIAIGTTIGAIAIYLQICKMNGKREHIKQIFQRKTEEKMITVPLILAVAATIVIMVLNF